MRNPPWTRDELILTLDFYHLYSTKIPEKTSKEVLELSKLLNVLQSKLGTVGNDTFRNPNGVYMKLMNFHRFNPEYSGKGLERGGKGDEIVWNLYSKNLDELRRIANSIRSHIQSDEIISRPDTGFKEEEEAEEGAILTRIHRYRERDTKIVNRKKEEVFAEKGCLKCQVCDFDFSEFYGEHGEGFIECHHNIPVSEMKAGDKTKLSDLVLVCSNCHRMIHRKRPWLDPVLLKLLLTN